MKMEQLIESRKSGDFAADVLDNLDRAKEAILPLMNLLNDARQPLQLDRTRYINKKDPYIIKQNLLSDKIRSIVMSLADVQKEIEKTYKEVDRFAVNLVNRKE